MKLLSDHCMLREPDSSSAMGESTEKHCGGKLTANYSKAAGALEGILHRYCPVEITETELQHRIEIFLIREFYAPAHTADGKDSKATRLWFNGAVIHLIDRPKIISLVAPVAHGVSYDVCIPVKRYLKEAFGIQELHELYNNVVLEAQDLQEVSLEILKDIKLWLDVIEMDQQGTAKIEDIKAIKLSGVCSKS